jgi:RNA polymerase sigma-70 factor (ECF subfamily)
MSDNSDFQTRASMFSGLRDAHDDRAWEAFVRRYEPLIRASCRKMRLSQNDEDEVTQTVLIRLLDAMPKFDYEPTGGRFRDWLARLARNKVIDFWRREKRRRNDRGSGAAWVRAALDEVPVPAGAELHEMVRELEEQGRRDHLFRQACERVKRRVRAHTWEAFRLTTLDRQKGAVVADRLGMSVDAVYMAKDRVLKMIRKEVRHLGGTDPVPPPRKGA